MPRASGSSGERYEYVVFLGQVRAAWPGVECYLCRLDPRQQVRCREVSGGVVDAHHLIAKQTLKREFPEGVVMFDGAWTRAWPDLIAPEGRGNYRHRSLVQLLMDPRNGIPLRRWHHDELEQRRARLTRRDLTADMEQFAVELGLGWYLERTYPT